MMIDAVVTHHGEPMTAQELNKTSYPLWKFCEHQLHFMKYNFYVWVTLTVHLSTNVGYKKLSFEAEELIINTCVYLIEISITLQCIEKQAIWMLK